MSTQKNLITLCFAAVFTLGLAACGGGGSDQSGDAAGTPMTPPPPTADEQTMAQDAVRLRTAMATAHGGLCALGRGAETAALQRPDHPDPVDLDDQPPSVTAWRPYSRSNWRGDGVLQRR